MRVLVTGGAGFIGSHTVDALIDRGYQVSIIDNLSTGLRENINPKASFHEADIRDKKVADIFEKERPEAVYHFAAQINLRRSLEDPLFDAERNILGSLNLLEYSREFKVGRFIFASSGGGVYGAAPYKGRWTKKVRIPTPESFPPLPASPYGLNKLAIEMYLELWQQLYGLEYIALRYANVYGPRQNMKAEAGVIAIFVDKLIRGESPIINGDGEQTRDYVFVKDVTAANLVALGSGKVGIFNIGTGSETSVNTLLDKILKNLGMNVKATRGPRIVGEVLRSALESKKAHEQLGWQPSFSLEEGIDATVEYFRRKQRDRR